ncbi:MAG: response regulator [Halarcobacter sp.]
MEEKFKELIKYTSTLKVLFVEDNEEVRIQLLKLLENFFTDIQIEKDGITAYENYIKNPNNYDLVITDLSMPKLDGIELSKRIMELNSKQIIIIISAHTESEKLLKLIDIGVYKFLTKPVDYKNLLETFFSVVEKIKKKERVS